MFGLLNIHKPAGLTSRDVVNRVQRIVKPHKAGHAGTLDPQATGVLVVCIGQATRLIEYVQRMPKRYVGTFLFGRQSDTEDVEGNVVELVNPPQPRVEEIQAALPKFTGEIMQVPPAFSALKVKGQRSYQLARKGEALEHAARPVMIHSIEIDRYEYPELVVEIRCGSGTYVRSLGRDIAGTLGTAAVMSALVRQEIGLFRLEGALDYSAISAETIERNLRPAIEAVADLPRIQLSDQEVQELAMGRQIANRFGVGGDEIAAIDQQGQLSALLKATVEETLRTVRFFPHGDGGALRLDAPV